MISCQSLLTLLNSIKRSSSTASLVSIPYLGGGFVGVAAAGFCKVRLKMSDYKFGLSGCGVTSSVMPEEMR